MLMSPFTPQGKSFLVDSTAGGVQVTTAGGGALQYRIRNRGSVEAWISYASTPGALNTVLPVVGTPQTGIIGMNGGVTETFSLPANCWFIASSGATFEVIAGEGQ